MVRSLMITVLAGISAVTLATAPLSAAPKGRKDTSHSLVGTLQKVDGQTLTIQTSRGPETVMLPASAHIRENGKTIQSSQLAGDAGSRVKVRYTEVNGQRQAQQVTISPARRVAKK